MDIHDFYDKMDRNKILLAFKGDITSDLLTSVLQIIESKMDTMQENPKLRKKVYIILVELLQNLYHHMDDQPVDVNDEPARTAIFMIGKEENQYRVITGNYIKKESGAELKQKIDEINSFSPEEIKEHYLKVLNNSEMSEKGGGGLGMIDIVRRTGKPLFYDFVPINDQFSFFTLNVVID